MLAVGSELIRIEVEDAAGGDDSRAAPAHRLRGGARRSAVADAGHCAPPTPTSRAPTPAAASRRRAAGDRPTPRRRRGAAPDRLARRSRRAPGSSASTCATSPPPAAPGRIVQADLDAQRRRAAARGRTDRCRRGDAAGAPDATHDDQDRRPAPQDRAEDAGVEAPHSALHLRRGSRRHRGRGACARALNAKWGAERRRPDAARRSWSARSCSRCASFRWSTPASTTRPACVTRHDAVHVGIATQTPARPGRPGGARRAGARPVGERRRDRAPGRRGAQRQGRRATS